jgi:hypothetical protein
MKEAISKVFNMKEKLKTHEGHDRKRKPTKMQWQKE